MDKLWENRAKEPSPKDYALYRTLLDVEPEESETHVITFYDAIVGMDKLWDYLRTEQHKQRS